MWMQGLFAEDTEHFAKTKPMLYRRQREERVAALQHLHGLPGEPWIFVTLEKLGCSNLAQAQKSFGNHTWVRQNLLDLQLCEEIKTFSTTGQHPGRCTDNTAFSPRDLQGKQGPTLLL